MQLKLLFYFFCIANSISPFIETRPTGTILIVLKYFSINTGTMLSIYITLQIIALVMQHFKKKEIKWKFEIITLILYIVFIGAGYIGLARWMASSAGITGEYQWSDSSLINFFLLLGIHIFSLSIFVTFVKKSISEKSHIDIGYLILFSLFGSIASSIYYSWNALKLNGLDSGFLWVGLGYFVIFIGLYRLIITPKKNKYFQFAEIRHPGLFYLNIPYLVLGLLSLPIILISVGTMNSNPKIAEYLGQNNAKIVFAMYILSALLFPVISYYFLKLKYGNIYSNNIYRDIRIKLVQLSFSYIILVILFKYSSYFIFGEKHYQKFTLELSYESAMYIIALTLILTKEHVNKLIFPELANHLEKNRILSLFNFPFGIFAKNNRVDNEMKEQPNKSLGADLAADV